ncbi:MAG: hypothetical protein IKX67_06925 [Bacteroidales bacterium]|nr:hypothetical protein [Bacteroidales bacterium]
MKGRIINELGEAVEYVQVGIPELQIGTISTADGRFEITAPRDTLEFFHVSYQTGHYAVTGPADDVVVVLHENELTPAVFVAGDTKEKYLLRPGTKIAGNGGVLVFEPKAGNTKGVEIGSVAKTGKPFLVRDIQFGIWQNSIPDCVVSVNIYRIEGKNEEFVNVLQKPIYVNVAESEQPQEFHLQPEETILLEPGKYFISFQIVDCDEKALEEYLQVPESERDWSQMRLSTILYFKSSYTRKAAMGKMEHTPVNIGMVVKGLEYQ